VIIEYLDTLHDGPKLYPSAWPQRLTALRRHALGQGMLDNALWHAKLIACVAALDDEAEALATSGFNIGHLTIGVALGYLDFRFAALRWRDGHPKLAAWHETFNARPSVQANLPVDDR
jgi:glutathione S-transferase